MVSEPLKLRLLTLIALKIHPITLTEVVEAVAAVAVVLSSNTLCQVCHKHGHDASICYNKFKKDYVPTIPLEDSATYQPTTLTLALSKGLHIQQLDVNNFSMAFWKRKCT
ncbi:hypothetical protein L195_g018405 [Trifolium pratense]|uniref:Uncharacterized protein n=1 Tax=Trifolium pratense TaxID=57577 RepID=A0A2K3MWP7_TRIPR|nr:hypothetical protein L195_g018405 [Trifolium pratense]